MTYCNCQQLFSLILPVLGSREQGLGLVLHGLRFTATVRVPVGWLGHAVSVGLRRRHVATAATLLSVLVMVSSRTFAQSCTLPCTNPGSVVTDGKVGGVSVEWVVQHHSESRSGIGGESPLDAEESGIVDGTHGLAHPWAIGCS